MPDKLIRRLQALHERTKAPGVVIDVRPDGRYVVEMKRPGKIEQRKGFRFRQREDHRLTVSPAWTEYDENGKPVHHRRSATE